MEVMRVTNSVIYEKQIVDFFRSRTEEKKGRKERESERRQDGGAKEKLGMKNQDNSTKGAKHHFDVSTGGKIPGDKC